MTVSGMEVTFPHLILHRVLTFFSLPSKLGSPFNNSFNGDFEFPTNFLPMCASIVLSHCLWTTKLKMPLSNFLCCSFQRKHAHLFAISGRIDCMEEIPLRPDEEASTPSVNG